MTTPRGGDRPTLAPVIAHPTITEATFGLSTMALPNFQLRPLERAMLDDLKIATELPIGDGALVLPPFPVARGSEVIDKLVAK